MAHGMDHRSSAMFEYHLRSYPVLACITIRSAVESTWVGRDSDLRPQAPALLTTKQQPYTKLKAGGKSLPDSFSRHNPHPHSRPHRSVIFPVVSYGLPGELCTLTGFVSFVKFILAYKSLEMSCCLPHTLVLRGAIP